ncbi:metal-dependent hydrolase [Halorarum halophilum]|uniref:Metal-dependent hydrolase n=1 Tax=Halorarum halophilum TaxID=2743090 RepID=A0A7D5GA82_9EURY|nr:metal-dependent hydrolase [Halobaculum halophilum]QLG26352.1 metal-dependent hydrolase [Halobaculum halophilum]
MPSTLVHVALGGLLAAALLPDRYATRGAIAVVLLTAALPDADSFVSPFLGGAHRSLGHNLLLPTLAGLALAYDLRVRDRSLLRARFGPGSGSVAWTALGAFVVAGVGLDLVTNGANLLWPVHDQFYTVDGDVLVSSERGVVHTFVDLSPAEPQPARTTRNLHYSTGVDPSLSPGAESRHVERVFPVVNGGWQLLLVAAGGLASALKLRRGPGAIE